MYLISKCFLKFFRGKLIHKMEQSTSRRNDSILRRLATVWSDGAERGDDDNMMPIRELSSYVQ